ncbi:MAG: hypothetical protein R3D25_16275 [Geminicoccaceae bacterium]
MRSPASRKARTVLLIAAMPEAKPRAASVPSRAASFASKAMTVGLSPRL